MGWLATAFGVFMAFAGFAVGSIAGSGLALLATLAIFPPLWRRLKARRGQTYPILRWGGAAGIGFVAVIVNAGAYSQTPEGRAAAARRIVAVKQQQDRAAATQSADAKAELRVKEAELASGEHCLSGWDGSFPRLTEAVKRGLRNPNSFEHVSTVRSPVDDKGTFGLVMTYRAQNGFGGMNVEAIGVEVSALTCDFHEVSSEALARRK